MRGPVGHRESARSAFELKRARVEKEKEVSTFDRRSCAMSEKRDAKRLRSEELVVFHVAMRPSQIRDPR